VILIPWIARYQSGWRRSVFIGVTVALAVASMLAIGNDPDYQYKSISIL
jgi:hypothetical protein